MKIRSKSSSVMLSVMVLFILTGCGGSVSPSSPPSAIHNEWTWMDGTNKIYQPGSYGTLGTQAPRNLPPGRWDAASWTDSSGNLWLFGGYGYAAATNTTGILLNDLWEFSPSLDEWTWMGGSSTLPQSANGWSGVYGMLGTSAVGNIPGSRADAANWVDTNGNFWLFGGTGVDATGATGGLNDLWEYSPSTNEWTWMGGSSTVGTNGAQSGVYGTLGTPAPGNIPGGRSGAVHWADGSGNFWLFGGSGVDANGVGGWLNDLWEFNPSTREWTWVGGSSTVGTNGGRPGVYGSLGTPSPGNIPGGRAGSVSWTDGSGNLWLFGGSGYDANGTPTALNDLWEFRFFSQQWVWMGGSTASTGCTTYKLGLVICAGPPGVYGSLGTPSSGNIPGGRAGSVSWTDGSGNLWLFGGSGYDSAGNNGNLNDLWKFNPSANDWTWMGGNTTEASCGPSPEGNLICRGQPGEYGTLGVPSSGNDPGARFGDAGWVDKQGNLWLFGGYGADSTENNMGDLNDLWEYQP
jgi:N-acetylneuraminic acid mutarotase